MDIKKISTIIALIVGSSTIINILWNLVVPRYEIEDMREDLYKEIALIKQDMNTYSKKKILNMRSIV